MNAKSKQVRSVNPDWFTRWSWGDEVAKLLTQICRKSAAITVESIVKDGVRLSITPEPGDIDDDDNETEGVFLVIEIGPFNVSVPIDDARALIGTNNHDMGNYILHAEFDEDFFKDWVNI